MNPSEADFLTPAAAAEYIRRRTGRGSVKSLATWRGDKTGPVWFRIGPMHVGYRLEDLENFVRSRVSGPCAPKPSAAPQALPTTPVSGWGSDLPPRR